MVLVIGAIAFVSFVLCFKSFTDEGLPLSKDKNIRGKNAKIIGILCGIFGVICVCGLIVVIMKIL